MFFPYFLYRAKTLEILTLKMFVVATQRVRSVIFFISLIRVPDSLGSLICYPPICPGCPQLPIRSPNIFDTVRFSTSYRTVVIELMLLTLSCKLTRSFNLRYGKVIVMISQWKKPSSLLVPSTDDLALGLWTSRMSTIDKSSVSMFNKMKFSKT